MLRLLLFATIAHSDNVQKHFRHRVINQKQFSVNDTIYHPWTLTEIAASMRRTHGKEKPLVLGMQVIAHDVSFAATVGGEVIGVIELERLHKSRYFDLSVAMQTLQAPGYKELMTAGMDAFVVPALRQLCRMAEQHTSIFSGEPCELEYDVAVVVGIGGMFTRGRLETVIKAVQWIYVDHHHAHAAAGWFDSPFYHSAETSEDVTLVLSYDGFGNDGTLRLFIGRAGNATLLPIGKAKIGHSYGAVYDAAASVVRDLAWGSPYGSTPPCPYKVNPSCQLALAGSFMAFAAIGSIRDVWRTGARLFVVRGLWDESLWPSPYNGTCALRSTGQAGASMLPGEESHFFACDGADEALSRKLDQDFAATIQSTFEITVLQEVQSRIVALQGLQLKSLVISGGIGLNVKVNSFLARSLHLPTHVPPAPGDNGLSVGAAWLVEPPTPGRRPAMLHFSGSPLLWKNAPLLSTDLEEIGRRWNAIEVGDVMQVATLLAGGAIVAVARGRAEFGPRSLGHRSLLSTATKAEQKDRLNRLKHRRWYRPCAPIVAAEDLEHVFEPGPDLAHGTPYMSFAPPLQKWVSRWLPGIAHIDNTARPQSVHRKDDPWMHSLLSAIRVLMEEQRPADAADQPPAVGVLINTSLNPKGKPMAADVEDVLRIFCMHGGEELDYVLLEESWLFNRRAVLSLGLCGSNGDDQDARFPDGLPVI